MNEMKETEAAAPEGRLDALVGPEREQGARICRENDGCPTEGDVLKREWRLMRAGLLAVIAADQVYGNREPHKGPDWHDGEIAKIARCYMQPNDQDKARP